MGILAVDNNKCNRCGQCITACPFGAVSLEAGMVSFNAACKLCKICLKSCPNQAITITDPSKVEINKDEWHGILVLVEHLEGEIHPITLELLGKARELAAKIGHPVYALLVGYRVAAKAEELLSYGPDRIFVYDEEPLRYYTVDLYANAFADCIRKAKPAIVLVGATAIGRSLAPRLAARFRTGLTADCTKLDVKPNTDLVQIRPAFGGNIMAQIITTKTRPQFATVRYKVMDQAVRGIPQGQVQVCSLAAEQLQPRIKVIEIERHAKQSSISDAEVLVVAGRGIKEPKDLALLEELATLLGGQLAVTRPLVESGWAPQARQIGLSGRTVKPKLIITCGVSGAVQFTACMNSAEQIFAINKDQHAPIFKIAHYGIVGDLYEVVPALIGKIKREEKEDAL
jgi:electron transfer flavoprotein alpha subunit